MSISITVVTTANRTLRYKQSDPVHVEEILASLRRATQLFTNRTLVIVSDTGTEIFSPSAIARIEFATEADLTPYLPPAWGIPARALAPDEIPPAAQIDDTHVATRIQFFFHGCEPLAIWFERERPSGSTERAMQITRIFEQAIFPYHLSVPGIGFMNPATMTHASIDTPLDEAPTGVWRASRV